MLECARLRLAHSRVEGDAFFSLVGGDRLRDAELSAQQAQAAALIAIAERLDTLIEIQQTIQATDVLDNFTEHGRESWPGPCGDDLDAFNPVLGE